MAGMLPRVEVARKRRIHHHHLDNTRELSFLRSRIAPSTTTAMDETALKARTRLEEKLRGIGYRWSKNQPSRDGESDHAAGTSKAGVRMEMAFHVDRRNSEKVVCAVCLDEIRAGQMVINLPCSHTYHCHCLLPWLNVHSHCPYCRTNVQS
ncbi:E3 ubiquitin-protein ligase SGR9, amyloplastic-like [Magnolia sinica]|uniref:E3 ubiquitin-protein ligase SGR9, amyloplastic-like n=1 Tax=Magnolia sinica TaxID=86752 RepID=UPI00265A20D1|nr:E3 ubiquitin-protein ligase SGR9, amyloplastic-like [Magnolia sinica]